uniref:MAGUK p55 subfamily member 7 n=1 Tax=Knipowitschia caucasica TaxID=637954 RepID=A0AAV2LBA4_KNICA
MGSSSPVGAHRQTEREDRKGSGDCVFWGSFHLSLCLDSGRIYATTREEEVQSMATEYTTGATIRRDDNTGAIVIARILRGGAADRSGLIHVGDELKEVNGIPVDDKKPEEIIRILAQSQGAITFKVVPGAKEEAPIKEPKIFMKAFFDYNPAEDTTIPCAEAGLAFKRGTILHIVSQDDPTWWQAKYQGEANPRAGLIPSKQFQERRLAVRQPVSSLPSSFRSSTRRSFSTCFHSDSQIILSSRKSLSSRHNGPSVFRPLDPEGRKPRSCVMDDCWYAGQIENLAWACGRVLVRSWLGLGSVLAQSG